LLRLSRQWRERRSWRRKLLPKQQQKLRRKLIKSSRSAKKREKKKAGAVLSQDSEESTEAVAEVAELEKTEGKVETPVPPKNKGWKENTTKHRARPRGPDSLPKVILKRKKATNYWLWAVPAVLVVLVLLAFSYSYLSQEPKTLE